MDFLRKIETKLALPPAEKWQVLREIVSHLVEIREELIASGMSAEEAQAEADAGSATGGHRRKAERSTQCRKLEVSAAHRRAVCGFRAGDALAINAPVPRSEHQCGGYWDCGADWKLPRVLAQQAAGVAARVDCDGAGSRFSPVEILSVYRLH